MFYRIQCLDYKCEACDNTIRKEEMDILGTIGAGLALYPSIQVESVRERAHKQSAVIKQEAAQDELRALAQKNMLQSSITSRVLYDATTALHRTENSKDVFNRKPLDEITYKPGMGVFEETYGGK